MGAMANTGMSLRNFFPALSRRGLLTMTQDIYRIYVFLKGSSCSLFSIIRLGLSADGLRHAAALRSSSIILPKYSGSQIGETVDNEVRPDRLLDDSLPKSNKKCFFPKVQIRDRNIYFKAWNYFSTGGLTSRRKYQRGSQRHCELFVCNVWQNSPC